MELRKVPRNVAESVSVSFVHTKAEIARIRGNHEKTAEITRKYLDKKASLSAARRGSLLGVLIGAADHACRDSVAAGDLEKAGELRARFRTAEAKSEFWSGSTADITENKWYVLSPGTVIMEKGHGGFLIPELEDKVLRKFYEMSLRFVEMNMRDLELTSPGFDRDLAKVYILGTFVNRMIKYERIGVGADEVYPLTRNISESRGVCREQAAILALLLKMHGYEDVTYKTGFAYDSSEKDKVFGHAWVRVKVNGEDMLIDPTNLYFTRMHDMGGKVVTTSGEYKEVVFLDELAREATENTINRILNPKKDERVI